MTAVFQTVAEMSAGAGILTVLILAARAIIGRRAAALLPLFYALLIFRLLIPVSIQSPASIQNALAAMPNATLPLTKQLPVSSEPAIWQSPDNQLSADNTAPAATEAPSPPFVAARTQSAPVTSPPLSSMDIMAIIWLSGMVLLITALVYGNTAFILRLRRNRCYDAPGFSGQLENCKKQLGINRQIRVIQCNEVGTAAVYGFLRPVLLISPGSFEALTDEQKRFVLLHELAHIQRGDTLSTAVATALCVLHWFNPLVWIALHLMRRDIEVLCDTTVLRSLGEEKRRNYAATLLELAIPSRLPRLATALFISHSNIKRRITMIILHKKKSVLFSALALLLALGIAVTGCTAAMQDTKNSADAQAAYGAEHELIEAEEMLDGLVLLGSYTVDYNLCKDDEARVANIEKGVALLDGTKIPINEQIGFMEKLLPVTEEYGWQTALGANWSTIERTSYTQSKNYLDDILEKAPIKHLGGGIELVAIAVWCAAGSAHMDQIITYDDHDVSITAGEMGLSNNGYSAFSDVVLRVKTEHNQIVAGFYGHNSEPNTNTLPSVIMSTYTLDFSKHASEGREYTINNAVQLLNGVVIAPGEELSINQLFGDRTAQNGWETAAGIENGGYAEVMGASVSMVSTALYNAALCAELTIVKSKQHPIVPDYAEPGLDATVSTAGPDLIIANPYDTDVTITATLGEDTISVSIFGPHRDHTVVYTSEVVGRSEAPEARYVYNTKQLPSGEPIPRGKSIEYSVSRGDTTVNVYKTLYNLDGKKIARGLDYTVTYPPMQGVIYVNGPEPN